MNLRTNLVKKYFPKNSVGAEVGVHLGEFSAVLNTTLNPTRLYLIDPWKNILDERYSKSWYGNKVTQDDLDDRYHNVATKFDDSKNIKIFRNFSKDITDLIPDNSLDFVYLDADHTFEGVCLDFNIFYKKVKKGGIIAGDDYTDNNWWGSGVIDAVHLNLHEKSLKILYLQSDQYGLVKI